MDLSHLPSSILSYPSQLTTLPTTNRSLQNSNALPMGGHGKHVWLMVRQLLMKAGRWDAPLALRGLTEAISITRSKISYRLIEPEPLLCTPAWGSEFQALAVHPHPTFTAPPVRSAFGIRSKVCWGVFLQKQSTCQSSWLFSQRSSIVDVLHNFKCDSAWGGFHHWGYTEESWTPSAS